MLVSILLAIVMPLVIAGEYFVSYCLPLVNAGEYFVGYCNASSENW